MTGWICPKCGRGVAPNVQTCPCAAVPYVTPVIVPNTVPYPTPAPWPTTVPQWPYGTTIICSM